MGFIRNLPHTLVTSFRATLEEVERAEILLHVQDAAAPMCEEQKAQVEKVLAELEVKKPVIQVLNKVDLLDAGERAVLCAGSGRVAVSGLTGSGLEELLLAIDAALVADPLVDAEFPGAAVGRRGAGGARGGRGGRAASASRGTWRISTRSGQRLCWGGTGGFGRSGLWVRSGRAGLASSRLSHGRCEHRSHGLTLPFRVC